MTTSLMEDFHCDWGESAGGVPIPRTQLGNIHGNTQSYISQIQTNSSASSVPNSSASPYIQHNSPYIPSNSPFVANSPYLQSSESPVNNFHQSPAMQSIGNEIIGLNSLSPHSPSPNMWQANGMDMDNELDIKMEPFEEMIAMDGILTASDETSLDDLMAGQVCNDDVHNQYIDDYLMSSGLNDNTTTCLDPQHSSPAAMAAVRPEDVFGLGPMNPSTSYNSTRPSSSFGFSNLIINSPAENQIQPHAQSYTAPGMVSQIRNFNNNQSATVFNPHLFSNSGSNTFTTNNPPSTVSSNNTFNTGEVTVPQNIIKHELSDNLQHSSSLNDQSLFAFSTSNNRPQCEDDTEDNHFAISSSLFQELLSDVKQESQSTGGDSVTHLLFQQNNQQQIQQRNQLLHQRRSNQLQNGGGILKTVGGKPIRRPTTLLQQTLTPNNSYASTSFIPSPNNSYAPTPNNTPVQHSVLKDMLSPSQPTPALLEDIYTPDPTPPQQRSARLSCSAPSASQLEQVRWVRREPRPHLLSGGSLAEEEAAQIFGTSSGASTLQFLEEDSEDTDNYDSDSDTESVSVTEARGGAVAGVSSGSKKERHFWQYNVQAKGPKGERVSLEQHLTDPHQLVTVSDPVFSPDCSLQGIKHSGKARRGDGNDLNPNPSKLVSIGKQLNSLNRTIMEMTPVSEQPSHVRPKQRKEKNKLASRACRLKKKAQHEANKIKLFGLGEEHKYLLERVREARALLVQKVQLSNDDLTQSDITKTIDEIAGNKPFLIAGNTIDFVNNVIEKTRNGRSNGGLDDLTQCMDKLRRQRQEGERDFIDDLE